MFSRSEASAMLPAPPTAQKYSICLSVKRMVMVEILRLHRRVYDRRSSPEISAGSGRVRPRPCFGFDEARLMPSSQTVKQITQAVHWGHTPADRPKIPLGLLRERGS